ncbi:PTS transporter subunit EIIC [Klebsiella variicola]|uniref:PTS transporter subunit EIIC n=1 Tax=Klebsiella variicola TaxID=244366 RepID=UPI0007CD1441|nr:PTS transporter subunit EIIC [Klebsiella variicola]SBH12832.1 PTS system beta-glucoside-specific transporter subunit IIABC [Klebsiella variicola]
MNNENVLILIDLIGGGGNIESLTHCATRLRFKIKDESKLNIQGLEELPEVLKVINSAGQFQIVIGPDVSHVYDSIIHRIQKIPSLNEGKDNAKKNNIINSIFDLTSGAFTPLLPCLACAGMLKALVLLLAMTGFVGKSSDSYIVLSAIQNSFFYFLPILLGVTLGYKLNVNPYISGMIGAALLEPTFITKALEKGTFDFFGAPILALNYSSSVFPIIISIILYAGLYKILNRIIPKTMHIIFVPFLSVLIVVPLTFLFFGPFGIYVGKFLASGITALLDFNRIIAGLIMGFIWIPVLLLGLHWAIIPIAISNIASGGDPIFAIATACTFSTIGAALGFLLKTKGTSLKRRGVVIAGLIPAILAGITEPILYSILLQYRKLLFITMTASAIGSGIIAFSGVLASSVFWSIFTLHTYSPVIGYITGGGVATIFAFLAALLMNYEDISEK